MKLLSSDLTLAGCEFHTDGAATKKARGMFPFGTRPVETILHNFVRHLNILNNLAYKP